MREATLNAIIKAQLAAAMETTGLKGKRLSKAAGLNEQAVRDIMKSTEDPRVGTLIRLADALHVPVTSLFKALVPIDGDIEAGDVIEFRGNNREQEHAPVPPTPLRELCAFCVASDTLRPAHRVGDVLYISRDHDDIDASFFDQECIVKPLGGETGFLGTLEEGTEEDRFNLHRIAAAPLKNLQLDWAAPVLFKASNFQRRLNGKSHAI